MNLGRRLCWQHGSIGSSLNSEHGILRWAATWPVTALSSNSHGALGIYILIGTFTDLGSFEERVIEKKKWQREDEQPVMAVARTIFLFC